MLNPAVLLKTSLRAFACALAFSSAVAHAATLDSRCELILVAEALADAPEILDWIRAQTHPIDLIGALSEIEYSNRAPDRLEYYGVDVVAEYLKREKLSDPHVKWLEYLGITVTNRDSKIPKFNFPSAGIVIARANAYTRKLVEKGEIKATEAIYLGVTYGKRSMKNQALEPPYAFEDLAFVRPGIDKKPDSAIYEPLTTLPQFEHSTWQEIIASGVLPTTLGVSNFMHHDLAHLTDLLDNPKLMAATRNYYKWAARQPMVWRKRVTLSNAKASVTIGSLSPMTIAHGDRLTLVTESLNLVSEKGKALVRERLKDFFGSSPAKNWQEHRSRSIEKIPFGELIERATALAEFTYQVTTRNGGAMRDPYNLKREVIKGDLFSPLKKLIYKNEKYRNEFDPNKTPTLHTMRESLLGLAESAKWLAARLTNPTLEFFTSKEILARGEAELRGLIAQLETGLAYSVILDVQPEDFFNELHDRYAHANSKTVDYISRFARPGGVLDRAFLSPEAQGTAPQTVASFLLELSEMNETIKFNEEFEIIYIVWPESSENFNPANPYRYIFNLENGELVQRTPNPSPQSFKFKSVRDLTNSDRAPLLYVLDLLKIDYSKIRRWK